MNTLGKLAKLVSGELIGSASIKITSAAEIEFAKEGDIIFVLSPELLPQAIKSKASAVVADKKSSLGKKPGILADNPRLAMAQILTLFAPPCEVEPGIHKTAVVHKSAKISKGARIGALVYIGPEVEIGDNTVIYPRVSLYRRTKIGKNCIIHSGVVIGIDGYGFLPQGGKFEKIPQTGKVIIGDDVEIYSNCCIARGTISDTIIKKGTKIDTLTHIAHNCEIGEDCAITSLVGLAGSVKLGNHVTVGGQAGFGGHIEVGDNTIVMGRAGVTKSIPANSVVSGFPALDHRKDLEIQAIERRLPQIIKKLKSQ